MSRLRLRLACWDYDRTRALREGRVQPDGIELDYLSLPVEQTFSVSVCERVGHDVPCTSQVRGLCRAGENVQRPRLRGTSLEEDLVA